MTIFTPVTRSGEPNSLPSMASVTYPSRTRSRSRGAVFEYTPPTALPIPPTIVTELPPCRSLAQARQQPAHPIPEALRRRLRMARPIHTPPRFSRPEAPWQSTGRL